MGKTALNYFIDECKNHRQIGFFDNTGSNELLKLIDVALKLEKEQSENDYKRGLEAGVESCNPKKVSYNEPCNIYLMGNNTTGACNNCNQPFNKHKFN